MTLASISKWLQSMSQRRADGASDEELADAWCEAATTLPDPSPEWDLAYHRVNAAAHDLGIGELTRPSWRHPTNLGQLHGDESAPEAIGAQWAEEYYKGCAIVCHVEGEPGRWSYRVYTVLPDFTESPKVEDGGFSTISECYGAGVNSQIKMIDSLCEPMPTRAKPQLRLVE